jgi:hypothetical protein
MDLSVETNTWRERDRFGLGEPRTCPLDACQWDERGSVISDQPALCGGYALPGCLIETLESEID